MSTSSLPGARADVGVFGGSGFTSFLDVGERVTLTTPWGEPSGEITVADVDGTAVAFLPRHGAGHRWPPHRVNYRANVHAMACLGVKALFAPFAAGSLRPDIGPGDFVVVDQFVDRTSGRAETFYEEFTDGPRHLTLADPYDERLRGLLVEEGRRRRIPVHDGGTVVVVNGPRFSTRAESAWFRAQGWDVVNMTQHPEAVLAAEAGIPYAGIALVTDHDTGLEGVEGVEPVTQEQVFEVFEANVHRVRDLLVAVAPMVPDALG